MNKLTKIGAVAIAALALGLSGAAQAAGTRSGDAVPSVAKKAVKRTVPLAGAKRSKIDGEEAALLGLGGAAIITGIVIAADGNGNGSGG